MSGKNRSAKSNPIRSLREQIQHLLVVDSDELRACLGVPPAVELAERQHAAADAVAGLEHRDAEAELLETAGAGEPRQPGADDDHVLPLRAEPEGHGCRGAEELAPGEAHEGLVGRCSSPGRSGRRAARTQGARVLDEVRGRLRTPQRGDPVRSGGTVTVSPGPR